MLSGLLGRLPLAEQVPSEMELVTRYPGVRPGGEWSPPHCVSSTHVAIIVPYRNRGGQLRYFLNHMHAFLARQELHYRIYVVNQVSANQQYCQQSVK